MSLPTQPYKGTRDFYPEDKRIQKYMFAVVRQVAEKFGYLEYDAPVLEPIEIYLSKSSAEIVSEQTYSFTDRGGRNVTMRPEMTPTLARMVAAKRQELHYPLRLYSIPNLWRYERPQAGRLREYFQPNFDLFGSARLDGDHELILLADSIWKAFGAKSDMYEIRINSRLLINAILADFVDGSDEQVVSLIRLIDHKAKMPHQDFLKAVSEIVSNGKEHELVEIISCKSFEDLPDNYKSHPSVLELIKLKKLLNSSGVDNVVDDLSLMRGFDYYTDIVFEVFDTHPENNRAMAGGGRYDGLVGLFGVEPVPTVGFALGDVTLNRFLEIHDLLPTLEPETKLAVILIGDVYERAQSVLTQLRDKGINCSVDATGRKLDTQLKHADKSGVKQVLFIGEKELETGQFKLKNLDSGEEKDLSLDQVVEALSN